MSEKSYSGFDDAFILRRIISRPPGKCTIALLGSSLFGRFKCCASEGLYFEENSGVLNLGCNLGGDRIRNVQRYLDKGLLGSLKHHQPNLRLMYIQMGDTDLTETGLRKSDAQAYARVVKSIRDELPDVKIVITAFFVQRGYSNAVIEEANQMLRDIADENGDAVSFLPFAHDQTCLMSDDRIHPNNTGYRRWYDLLQDDMKKR
ncbi:hypothetical protein FLONG3_4187 [Fusarium longipes]|uniref:SGNH hydrolase-type esterase domain-containing protein n=1 Tax=Fusarium longipes TaxID=694270 RepID=A0A395SYP8_9HYPO|nr:hypothetical protein FLONG3_4187 [Fusarium longipes]